MTTFKLDITLDQDLEGEEVTQVARNIANQMFTTFPEHKIMVVGHNGGESEFAIANPIYLPQFEAEQEEAECISC